MLHDFLDHEAVARINESLFSINKLEKRGGIRRIEQKCSTIKSLVFSEKMLLMANKVLGSKACFVRAILFNKTVENNWMVSWHQDRTVAVSERVNIEGWGPWSIKDGVHHVQPPIEVLENMITFRLHLDNVNKENGCLKVIPDSYQHGILSSKEIQQIITKSDYVNCEGKAGSMLMMRPHVLHASSKVSKPTQRRVLHLEYSNFPLPKGITWA